AMDVAIARDLLGKGTTTRGDDWTAWFPSASDVPGQMFEAYKTTLEALYGPGARRNRGFGDFEAQFTSLHPPPPTKDLLSDAYTTFRTVVDTGTSWDYWDWLGVTSWMFIPALLCYPIVLGMPQGKHLLRDQAYFDAHPDIRATYNEDQAKYEIWVM